MAVTRSHHPAPYAPTPTVLLTTDEVASVFSVSTRTVKRWAAIGLLERVRIGGVTRFRADDLERVLHPETNEAPVATDASYTDASQKAAGTGPHAES